MKQSKNMQIFFRNIAYLATLAFTLGFQACNSGSASSSKVEILIPKDAQFVLAIKFDKLSKKASNWKEFINNKKNLKEAEKNLAGQGIVMDILGSESIDEEGAAYLFGALEGETGYASLVVLLKDEAKFEKAITEGKEKFEVKDKDGWKYAYKKGSIIAWKDTYAVLVFGDKGEEDLLKQAQGIKDTKKTESLSNTASYQTLDEGDYEAFVWMNQNEITQSQSFQALAPFLLGESAPYVNIFGELSDFTSLGISFQKGKMLIDAKVNFNDQLDEKYMAALKPKLDTKGFSKIPVSKPVMLGGMSVDMNVLYDLMNTQGLLEDIPEELEGMTAKEIFGLATGNVLFAASSAGDKADVILALEIANQKDFEKVVDIAAKKNNYQKKGDYYVMDDGFLIIKEGMAFIATTEKSRDAVLKGGASVPASYTKELGAASLSFFMDAQAVIKENRSEIDNAELAEKSFESISAALTFKDKVLDLKLIFNMKEKGKNALEVIIELSKEAVPA